MTIKALGWIIALLWVLALLLPVTVAFSLFKLVDGRNMGIQEPTFVLSNGNLSINMPFYINNTGFYELTQIGLNIQLGRANRTIIALAEHLPNVPAGDMLNTSFETSTSLKEIFSRDRELLTADVDLDVAATLGFRVAHAIAFNVAMNFPTSWGAPFYNLTIYNFTYNYGNGIFSFSISFENHAFFSVNGPLLIELYNSRNESIGSAPYTLNISTGDLFQRSFEVPATSSEMTRNGLVRLYFGSIEIREEEWNVP